MTEERRTTPVELLWDLVFVFAVTQVTALIARDLTWANVGRGLLVLALVWWAWSAFVWATNAADPDGAVLRAVLLVATVLIFVCGLVLPRAWEDQAVLFVVAYAGVRFMPLGLYADVSRRGNASWSAIAGFGPPSSPAWSCCSRARSSRTTRCARCCGSRPPPSTTP